VTQRAGGSPRRGASHSPWRPLLPLGIALVAMVVFLPGLDGAFLEWDDRTNFLQNPHYRGFGLAQLRWMATTGLMGHWIPLTWFSLAVDWSLWGLEPFGYHLTSLILHGTAAALFYFVARRLLARAQPRAGDPTVTLGAGVAALFFAIHPLRVESVAWITERRDVLSGLFFLATTLVYLGRWTADGTLRPRGRLRYAVSLIFFAAAVLSKSMTVTLPAVLVILDVYPLRRLGPAAGGWLTPRARAVWLEKIPYLLLSAATIAVTFAIHRGNENLATMDQYGLVDRLALCANSLVFYLWKTLVPIGLSPMYELPATLEPWRWPFVGAAVLALAITAATLARARRWPALLAAWIAYGIMLIPVSGLFQNGFQFAADRYTYLPCLPWALLAGAGVAQVVTGGGPGRRARTAIAVTGFAFVVLGTLSWRQTHVWHDTESLWLRVLAIGPSSVAHSNLGLLFARAGDTRAAIPHYQAALALRPTYAEAWNNLALTQVEEGDLPGAEKSLAEAIRLKPRYATAWSNLGMVRARQGQAGEAITAYREALRLSPGHADAHGNLGATLDAEGRGDEAFPHLREAARLRPDSAEAQGNLGTYYARRGDFAAATAYYVEAVRLRPQSPEAHNNLGLALAQQGRMDAAAAHFQEAVRLRPGYRDAQSNLARAQTLLRSR